MTAAEIAPFVGLAAFALSLYNVWRAEQIRKQGITEELKRILDALERRILVVEVRLDPVFRAMSEQVMGMFHKPHPGYEELDRLLERFAADDSDLKYTLRESELDRLVDLLARERAELARHQRTGTEKLLQADLSFASVVGIRDARMALRRRQQEAEHHRAELQQWLRGRRRVTGDDTPWYKVLWEWFSSFRQ